MNVISLSCPVCRKPLGFADGCLKCVNGHCFDRAKQGYYNLLLSNAQGKRHGDDKLMVRARRSFLEKGYYSPLRDAVCEMLGTGQRVLDAGCGEGYYTSAFALGNRVVGIDISKDALKLAARRCPDSLFAVASLADLPLADNSVDAVVNIFAPDSPSEFLRVLDGGQLITVTPMERHLIELKSAVYDSPYLNPPVCTQKDGFTFEAGKEVKYTAEIIGNEDIVSLFMMTPYYYKTSREDQQKLGVIDRLTVSLEFYIAMYQKNDIRRQQK